MEWTNDLTLEFLRLYEQEPCIWNPRDPSYKNRVTVGEAWKRIETEFSMKCSIPEMKRKRDSLMAMFRTLLTKVKASKKVANDESDVYKPSWFAFKVMAKFLDGIYQPRSPTMHTEGTEHFEISFHDEMQDLGIQEDEQGIEMCPRFETHVSSQTAFPWKDVRHPRPKRTRRKPKTKRFQNNAHTVGSVPNKFPKISDEDDCSLYVVLLARKLRGFDDCTREILMNKIDNLVFRAKMCTKNYPSHSIRTPSPPHHSGGGPSAQESYNYSQYSYVKHDPDISLGSTFQPQSSPGNPHPQPTSTPAEISYPKPANMSETL